MANVSVTPTQLIPCGNVLFYEPFLHFHLHAQVQACMDIISTHVAHTQMIKESFNPH